MIECICFGDGARLGLGGWGANFSRVGEVFLVGFVFFRWKDCVGLEGFGVVLVGVVGSFINKE